MKWRILLASSFLLVVMVGFCSGQDVLTNWFNQITQGTYWSVGLSYSGYSTTETISGTQESINVTGIGLDMLGLFGSPFGVFADLEVGLPLSYDQVNTNTASGSSSDTGLTNNNFTGASGSPPLIFDGILGFGYAVPVSPSLILLGGGVSFDGVSLTSTNIAAHPNVYDSAWGIGFYAGDRFDPSVPIVLQVKGIYHLSGNTFQTGGTFKSGYMLSVSMAIGLI